MVELGLALPLLTVVVFGTVDLGRAYRLKTGLANAAHEGAAFAQFHPTEVDNVGACTDPNNILFAARNEGGSSNDFTVTVAYTTQAAEKPPAVWVPVIGCSDSVRAARVVVTASAPFQLATPLLSCLTGDRITLHESSEVVVP